MQHFTEWSGAKISEQAWLEASDWLARMDRQEFDEISFSAWLYKHPDNSLAYFQLSEMWAKSACLREAEQYIERSSVITFPTPISADCGPMSVAPESLPVEILADDQVVNDAPAWTYYLAIGLAVAGLISSFF